MSRRRLSPEELAARAEWTAACDAAEELRRQAEELSRQHDAALGRYSWRIGKRAAGRLLDGRTWDEVPS
jgi:protein gp37